MIVRIINDLGVIGGLVQRFFEKSKYARTGHYWWVLDNIANNPRLLHLGVYDENGCARGLLTFAPEGKEEAMCVLVYVDNGVNARRVVREAKKILRKLGIRRVYSYVWGPVSRGKAAARLVGGKVEGTLLSVEV